MTSLKIPPVASSAPAVAAAMPSSPASIPSAASPASPASSTASIRISLFPSAVNLSVGLLISTMVQSRVEHFPKK
jgi:hypothetical protein